ncbi:uncharacterized protein LOC111131419 [Crassostrea virginica]
MAGRFPGGILWSALWALVFVTCNCQHVSSNSTVCNLCSLPGAETHSSDIYTYTENPYTPLYPNRSVDQKYQNHRNGDCFGSVDRDSITRAWWSIILPGLATIYKVNLLFRENYTRHSGYDVFISKSKVGVNNLSSLTPVYHEENPYPPEQSIIQFPDGRQGQHLYIILNKNYSVLDICEVEIWGFLNHTSCTGKGTSFTEGIYNSYIPWNNVTLVCYQRSIQISNISSCSHLNETCDIRLTEPDNITFRCSGCTDSPYNSNTTDSDTAAVQHYVVDKTITLTCKRNHRLVSGNLTRVCLENGLWSGKEPVCKICTCPCQRLASQNFIKDPIVLKKRIKELKKILAVNRSKLSASIRKKTSSRDDRMSSKGIGMVLGVGVITFVLLTIVCSDLLMFLKRRSQK